MREINTEEAVRAMHALQAQYPPGTISDENVKFWATKLKGFDWTHVHKGIGELVKNESRPDCRKLLVAIRGIGRRDPPEFKLLGQGPRQRNPSENVFNIVMLSSTGPDSTDETANQLWKKWINEPELAQAAEVARLRRLKDGNEETSNQKESSQAEVTREEEGHEEGASEGQG